MEISASLVKELRNRTGAGLMDCKVALKESNGSVEKAIEYLRIKGLASAEKRSGRETAEGLVVSYIHPGSRLGVLLEVNCETDFVARTDEFKQLSHDLAMQIAATSPLAIMREDLPQDIVEKEQQLFREQAMKEKKPEKVIEKIVEGRMEKFYAESCLLEQIYIKDDSKKVKDLINETAGKLGENVKVLQFARFQIGQ
jgi:elongation factor Ts